MDLSKQITQYLDNSLIETIELIKEICKIPAPSHYEEKRAEFCKNWLEKNGAKNVYIDVAKNMLYPINCDRNNDIVLFTAHTDTVFPDTESMPFKQDENFLYSPGVGDDTTCLAILLMVVKFITINKLKPKCGILFAANSCEEGLGNLKGIKQIMKDYGGRIKEVYSFDAQYNSLINKCVGSHRYEIIFKSKGGHSYRDFGNVNAIYVMSEFITKLYKCKIPIIVNSNTTYNVGVVNGGTSINVIAQEAKMMYEYRSDNAECLSIMKKFLYSQIQYIKNKYEVEIVVNMIGIRPCQNDIDEKYLLKMSEKIMSICEKHSRINCVAQSGSTDCNIPMSLGIPALAVGCYLGDGEHTREEKVLIKSIPIGLKIVAEIILEYFN